MVISSYHNIMTFTFDLQMSRTAKIKIVCLTNHAYLLKQQAHLQSEKVSLYDEGGYIKSLAGKNNKM